MAAGSLATAATRQYYNTSHSETFSAARSKLKELACEEQPASGGHREVETPRGRDTTRSTLWGSLQTSRPHRSPHDTPFKTHKPVPRNGRSLWHQRGSTTGQPAAS